MLYSNKEHSTPIFYLFQTRVDDFYFGHLTLPNKNSTIDEYNLWQEQYTPNCICINQSYAPQRIQHKTVEHVLSFDDMWSQVQTRYSVENGNAVYNWDEIGDRINQHFDFRELLIELFEESINLKNTTKKLDWIAIREIISVFYIKKIKKILEKDDEKS